MSLKAIAINLPQFHPFAENDEWWGKGFTEWTNVTKAKPLFKGHYQPHLPSDLGFYDLRLAEARIAQAELAKQYGIQGFCYYHYWFNGKRLMNTPVDQIIKSGKPNFPFMLCWANENWSRRWDGQDTAILIEQNYSHEDDVEHIRFLLDNVFNDPRYIRVNNKPFFLIYRPSKFPDIKQTLKTWREEAQKQGIELYLGYMKTAEYCPEDVHADGFDCSVHFQPELWNLPPKYLPFASKVQRRLGISKSIYLSNYMVSYPAYVDSMIQRKFVYRDNEYPGITPGFDNTARRTSGAVVFLDSSPVAYARWLAHIKKQYEGHNSFLFINAWNEWAEGNHLEPCQRWGTQYLQATQKILNDA